MTTLHPHPPRVSLVGRDRELAILTSGLEEALNGRGHLYALSGEPGVGKTRLLEETAAAAAGHEAIVTWGRCWEREGAPPFWPWERILGALLKRAEGAAVTAADAELAAQIARLVPRHPFAPDRVSIGPATAAEPATAAPEAGLQRFVLFDAIATFLQRVAARLPLVLLLDDLHAAQLQALLLLEFVARELHGTPLLLVAAYRETEAHQGGALGERLGELARLSTAIPLRGLDADATRALAAAVAGRPPSAALARILHDTTAGNPFFVDEVVRLLLAEGRFDEANLQTRGLGVPDRVRSAVRARLAPLPSPGREALRAAAVVGQEFDAVLLAEALAVSSETLSNALAAPVASGFVRRMAGGGLRFAHGLIRDTIYEDIEPETRIHLHCRIGAALEARHAHGLDVVLPELAHNFLSGQPEADSGRALVYARRAGERAFELCAYEKAATYFQQAIRLFERGAPADPATLGELRIALGRAFLSAGDPARAQRAIGDAAREARRLGSRSLLAQAALALRGGVDGVMPDFQRVALLDEALAAHATEESSTRARLLAHLASELFHTGEIVRRDELCRQALALSRAVGDPSTLALALTSRCAMLSGPRVDEERLPLTAELLALAGGTGDRELAFEAHQWRLTDYLALADVAGVDRELAAATAIAERLARPDLRSWVAFWRAMRAIVSGRFDDALALSVEGHALGEHIQPLNSASTMHSHFFAVAWLRGELEPLLPAIEGIWNEIQTTYPEFRAGYARVLIGGNRPADARREFEILAADDFAAIAPERLGGRPWTWVAAPLVETCVGLGDLDRGAVLYEKLRPHTGRMIVTGIAQVCYGPVDRYLGLLAAAGEDWDAAADHLATGLSLSQRVTSPPFIAMMQQDLAAMLVARGRSEDRAQAATLAEAALETAERLGMRGVAQQARALHVGLHAAAGDAAVSTAGEEVHGFTREGEYWTVRYRGLAYRLRDRVGFTHLAALLERPHQEIPALVLVAGAEAPERRSAPGVRAELPGALTADLGEVLDPRARAEYRERLREIELEIDEAEQAHDMGRVTRLRDEAERLQDGLSAALGLGGRARRTGSPAERARVRVTRALRETIDRIHAVDAGLGEHLARSVRTGTYCCYAPREETAWTVSRRA